MDPYSFVPALAVLLITTGTAWLLVRAFGAAPSVERDAALDGLRGYLALFVFLHHSAIWYGYLRTGRWQWPPSNLYVHFGHGSVALFFMITGFLFFTKLLDARAAHVDWTRLYVSRVLRLTPLYAFVVGLLLLMVAFLSSGVVREPAALLARHVFAWLAFTMPSAPDVNALADTHLIVAGVTWTLPYEWVFYLSLPVLGIAARTRTSVPWLLGSAAVLAATITLWPHARVPFAFFSGGIAAALAVRHAAFRALAAGPLGSAIAIACLAVLVACYSTPYGVRQLVLMSAAFCLIAGGASLFGLLTNRCSRILGDISYSVYLLHGLVLFVTFRLALAPAFAAGISPQAHWLVILAVAPLLVLICFAAFHIIEAPALRSVPRATAWLRSRMPGAAPDAAVVPPVR